MAKKLSRSTDASLRPDLQELIDRVGLAFGDIKLVIHEGSIQFVELNPRYRVDFVGSDDADAEPQVAMIRLYETKPFVRSRLERSIKNKIGRFGHVKLWVENGRMSDWHFAKRYKNTA